MKIGKWVSGLLYQTMFVVYTEHPIEKTQLQEEHHSVNQHFYVASHQTQTLVNLLRSITFEYFRGSPTLLAKKLTQLTTDCLNLSLSLTLFREMMAGLKECEERLQLYQSYFRELSSHLVQEKGHGLRGEGREQETSFIQELLQLQEPRSSKFINDTDIQQTLEQQLNHRKIHSKLQRSTITGVFQTPDGGLTTLREKLDLSYKKILNCHNMSQESHWWKLNHREKSDSHDENQSCSLSEFNYRGTNVMRQDTIQELLRKDAKLDKEIAAHLSKDLGKNYEGTARFLKKMKQKLIAAKLNRRKRR